MLSIFSPQLLLSRFRNLDPCLKRHFLSYENNLMESTAVIIACDFKNTKSLTVKGDRAFLVFFIWFSFIFSIWLTLGLFIFSWNEIFFGFWIWQVVPINFVDTVPVESQNVSKNLENWNKKWCSAQFGRMIKESKDFILASGMKQHLWGLSDLLSKREKLGEVKQQQYRGNLVFHF